MTTANRLNFEDPRTSLPSATPDVMREWKRLQDALSASVRSSDLAANRNWFGRLVIVLWAMQLPIISFGAAESLLAHELARGGLPSLIFMLCLTVLVVLALFDSIANWLYPARLRIATCLMRQRHIGFMLLAAALVICGAGMQRTHVSVALVPFFIFPAVLCVVVTVLDLRARHKERCP